MHLSSSKVLQLSFLTPTNPTDTPLFPSPSLSDTPRCFKRVLPNKNPLYPSELWDINMGKHKKLTKNSNGSEPTATSTRMSTSSTTARAHSPIDGTSSVPGSRTKGTTDSSAHPSGNLVSEDIVAILVGPWSYTMGDV